LVAFRQAAVLNPGLPNIEENWGKALLLLGRPAEAGEHFARAARLRQQSAGAPAR
jgi:Tfp pilus assembly protein PilF